MPAVTDLTVFLIEDDDVAREAFMRSLHKSEIQFPVITASDGVEALAVLRGEHPCKRIDGPRVILLDLNMPRMNGLEFLRELRADPSLAANVVFVLTTSSDDNDRARAYEEHIAGYMVKSAVGPQFSKLVSLLQDYQSSVELPQ